MAILQELWTISVMSRVITEKTLAMEVVNTIVLMTIIVSTAANGGYQIMIIFSARNVVYN